MGKAKDPTLRDHKLAAAAVEWVKMMVGYPILPIELVSGKEPADDVLMYRVVVLKDGTLRAGITFDYPGRNKSLYMGMEGDRPAVVRWLCTHGVPTVRLASNPGV